MSSHNFSTSQFYLWEMRDPDYVSEPQTPLIIRIK